VLVSLMDYGSGTRTNYSTCTEYCATANLPCKGQFRSSPTMAGTDAASEGYFHSCARDLRQTLVCESPLPDPHEAGGDHDGDVMEASTPARFDGRRLHEHGHAGSGTGRGVGADHHMSDLDTLSAEEDEMNHMTLRRWHIGVPERVCLCR